MQRTLSVRDTLKERRLKWGKRYAKRWLEEYNRKKEADARVEEDIRARTRRRREAARLDVEKRKRYDHACMVMAGVAWEWFRGAREPPRPDELWTVKAKHYQPR